MYDIFTEIPLMDTRGIENFEEARRIAETYAAQGHHVEIRDAETGATVALYNCDEE